MTYRESLRDIETCLRAHHAKLYHLGIRGNIARSTLADANEQRDNKIQFVHVDDMARLVAHLLRRIRVPSPPARITHCIRHAR